MIACSRAIDTFSSHRLAAALILTSARSFLRQKCYAWVFSVVNTSPTARTNFRNSWFTRARLSPKHADTGLNCFGVNASQSLAVWRRKGWIYQDDPRGWFQWYCRYYLGRRLPDEDARQIKRWKAMRRHVRQIQMNCESGDIFCRKRQRQALCIGPTTAASSNSDTNTL